MKRTRLYVGVTLLIQAASLFIMFIMLCRKKKGLSKLIFILALAGGLTGAYLLCSENVRYPRRRKSVKSKATNSFADDDWLFEEEDNDEIEIYEEDCEV
jgi:hypothetical protein